MYNKKIQGDSEASRLRNKLLGQMNELRAAEERIGGHDQLIVEFLKEKGSSNLFLFIFYIYEIIQEPSRDSMRASSRQQMKPNSVRGR